VVAEPITIVQVMPGRFGGERPWFVSSIASNGVHCWRRVIKLYAVGRLWVP
jgi:hypothetical protein